MKTALFILCMTFSVPFNVIGISMGVSNHNNGILLIASIGLSLSMFCVALKIYETK